MRRVAALVVVLAMATTGCASFYDGKLSWNMTQSVSRGGGDAAMTAMLDGGTDAQKAREYVSALIELLESGTIDKATLRSAALRLASEMGLTGAVGYVDALMAIVPGHISQYQKIPQKYRDALLSFMRDGAVRALDLYNPDKRPKPSET